jgi:nucleotide-binding universal stress UspA family protein
MFPRRLLLPLDGSRAAERALAYARALAVAKDLSIVLLGVVDETLEINAFPETESQAQQTAFLTSRLTRAESDLRQVAKVSIETNIVSGVPATSILTTAERSEADLLLISRRGRSGTTRWPIGGVAEKVIRAARCDVLLVDVNESHGRWLTVDSSSLFSTCVVPLDGSELAKIALTQASFFRDSIHTKMHLVRAVPLPALTEDSGYVAEKLIQNARSYLERTAAELGLGGLSPVSEEILLGEPSDELQEYLAEGRFDVVAISSRGAGRAPASTLGRVADRICRGANTVLLVKP